MEGASADAQRERKGMPISLRTPQLRELKPRIMVCGVRAAPAATPSTT